MANQGAKKRKEENARHMKTLIRIIIVSNVIYLAIRIGVFYSSFTWKHCAGLILTSLAYVLPYQQLAAMAKPAYTDDGDLLDGGFDMSTGGICGYLHDVIYITCFVQLSSIISEKFWYIYLVIPGFTAYQLFGLVKGFLPTGSSEGAEEDEKTRKEKRWRRGLLGENSSRPGHDDANLVAKIGEYSVCRFLLYQNGKCFGKHFLDCFVAGFLFCVVSLFSYIQFCRRVISGYRQPVL